MTQPPKAQDEGGRPNQHHVARRGVDGDYEVCGRAEQRSRRVRVGVQAMVGAGERQSPFADAGRNGAIRHMLGEDGATIHEPAASVCG